jgi:hypothetical protein
MAAKRGQRRDLSEWSKRLLGLVLCAFFGLGVLVGARMGVWRMPNWLAGGMHVMREMVGGFGGQRFEQRPGPATGATIALVRRAKGFYTLSADGSIAGPTSPGKEADLPILSGAGIEQASGSALLDYAALAVRAEAALSQTVSELRVGADGTVRVYLGASPTEIILEPSKAEDELERAAWVMRRWHGHERLIAALDVTPADAAAVRFHSQGRAWPAPSALMHTAMTNTNALIGRRPAAATGRAAR